MVMMMVVVVPTRLRRRLLRIGEYGSCVRWWVPSSLREGRLNRMRRAPVVVRNVNGGSSSRGVDGQVRKVCTDVRLTRLLHVFTNSSSSSSSNRACCVLIAIAWFLCSVIRPFLSMCFIYSLR